MVVWIYFYLKALSEGDASVVMTMLVLAPFFSFIFAGFVLHELPTIFQLFSGFLIILGALSVSYEPSSGSFKWTLIAYAVAASVVTGLMHTLFKFATVTEAFWESIFWRSVGMILVGLLLYLFIAKYRKNFHTFIQTHFKAGISLNTSNESLTLLGDTIFAFAILFAPLALVQTTDAYQPIFILILVFVLSRVGFSFVTEGYGRRQLLFRILGIILALVGGLLLAYFS
jgi:hypothetical protein